MCRAKSKERAVKVIASPTPFTRRETKSNKYEKPNPTWCGSRELARMQRGNLVVGKKNPKWKVQKGQGAVGLS